MPFDSKKPFYKALKSAADGNEKKIRKAMHVMRSVEEKTGSNEKGGKAAMSVAKGSIKELFIHEKSEEVIKEDLSSFEYVKNLNLKDIIKNEKPPVGVDAKEFYKNINASAAKQAESGPIFTRDILGIIERVPFSMDKRETQWVANVLKNNNQRDRDSLSELVRGNYNKLRYVLDYTRGTNVDISRFKNFDSAFVASQEWHETLKNQEQKSSYSSNQVVLDFGDGYKILKLNEDDLGAEGEKMGHCVGGRDYYENVKSGKAEIYSLRDKNNNPHVTFELIPSSNVINQIYGKEDKRPVEKYWSYMFKFLDRLPNVVALPVINEKGSYSDNKNFPEQEVKKHLEKGIKSKNVDVRSSVASNPNTPPEALVKLSKDEEWEIRSSVAQNPNTPPEALVNLSKDEDWVVRSRVAQNPNTPPEALVELSKDEDWFVRSSAVKNPNFPKQESINLNSIKELFIHEKTRSDKEGVPEQDIFEYLKQFVNDNPTHFISFVEVPKLGINPMSKYDTPIGIYCYPLTSQIYNQFKTNSLPFAGDKPYFVLFKASPSTKFFNIGKITKEEFEKSLNKLAELFPNSAEQIRIYQSEAKPSIDMLASYLWNITRNLSRNAVKWNATLRNLGYDAAIDLGDGLIYGSEPTQAVFFSFKPINVINIFDNPNKSNKKTIKINFDKISKRDEEALLAKNDISTNNIIAKSTKNKEILLKLSKSENKIVRSYVAENPNTPPEALVNLSKDEDWSVRCGVAKNASTAKEVLIKLSKDKDNHVRSWVAENPNTPSEILIRLSKDKDWSVRSWVAQNPNTPPEALVNLSKDKNHLVRSYAASNPNFPKQESINLNSIKELFKFTQSANDNTSFLSPPHQGSGFPSAYGKSMQSYAQYDPSLSVKKGKKREDSIKGRAHQKVTRFNGGKEFTKKDLNINLSSIKELFMKKDKSIMQIANSNEKDLFAEYLKQISAWVNEAEYKGRNVELNKPTRGDVKKFKVYVKDPKTGNVKKVNFGDPNMKIKKSDPDRRRSFRARHKCDQKKDKTTAGYWSCKKW